MALIADGLVIAAALTAAIYCMVLARRVQRLASLDRGLGAGIAQLSRQVDELTAALGAAKRASSGASKDLRDLTARAEIAAGRLELLLATLHETGDAGAAAGSRDGRARPGRSLARDDRDESEAAAEAGKTPEADREAGPAADPEAGFREDDGRTGAAIAGAPRGRAGDAPGDPLRRRLRAILDGDAA